MKIYIIKYLNTLIVRPQGLRKNTVCSEVRTSDKYFKLKTDRVCIWYPGGYSSWSVALHKHRTNMVSNHKLLCQSQMNNNENLFHEQMSTRIGCITIISSTEWVLWYGLIIAKNDTEVKCIISDMGSEVQVSHDTLNISSSVWSTLILNLWDWKSYFCIFRFVVYSWMLGYCVLKTSLG